MGFISLIFTDFLNGIESFKSKVRLFLMSSLFFPLISLVVRSLLRLFAKKPVELESGFNSKLTLFFSQNNKAIYN